VKNFYWYVNPLRVSGFSYLVVVLYTKPQRRYNPSRNLCMEDNNIYLDYGTTKMFLRTKRVRKDVSKPLKNFFDYVDGHASADEGN